MITALGVAAVAVHSAALMTAASAGVEKIQTTVGCASIAVPLFIEHGFLRMIVDAVDVPIDTGRRKAEGDGQRLGRGLGMTPAGSGGRIMCPNGRRSPMRYAVMVVMAVACSVAVGADELCHAWLTLPHWANTKYPVPADGWVIMPGLN